jgi:uncharacterized MAPEG superfamily protein
MRFITWLVNLLSKNRLVVSHGSKIKFLLMVYPYFLISYLNHWVAGLAGCGSFVFIASILIKVLEEKSGLSYYLSRSTERSFLYRVDSLKIIILFVLSVVFSLGFSIIDPMKILYPFGGYRYIK